MKDIRPTPEDVGAEARLVAAKQERLDIAKLQQEHFPNRGYLELFAMVHDTGDSSPEGIQVFITTELPLLQRILGANERLAKTTSDLPSLCRLYENLLNKLTRAPLAAR